MFYSGALTTVDVDVDVDIDGRLTHMLLVCMRVYAISFDKFVKYTAKEVALF